MKTDKYCIDCVHSSTGATTKQLVCTKNINEVDNVTGERRYEFCKDVRADEAKCGPDSRWFERFDPFQFWPFAALIAGLALMVLGLFL